jgi:rod shape-determining protein MreD
MRTPDGARCPNLAGRGNSCDCCGTGNHAAAGNAPTPAAERFGLLTAFILGIVLDILHGQLLGQNALALCVMAYITVRFHLQIRIFPLWQMTMTVLALLTLVAALQFIIEGMAGFGAIGLGRWPAVICGTLLWQPVMALLDRVREQCEMRSSNF